jgi:Peptidase A4 family
MRRVLKLGLYLAPIPVIAVTVVAVLAPGVGAPHAAAAQISRPHSVPRIHLHDGGRNSTSTNWSGYANTGATFTDVKGSWTVPSVTCSSGQTAYSSFWVGIDGDTTNTVEQTGTDSDCQSGTPTYYAWYEMYPKGSVLISGLSVSSGDSMTAEVSTNGRGSFTLRITDSRSGSFTTNQTSRKARLGSAEWIAEAPSSGGILPLADFGTVNFSSCTANGASISSNPNPDAITMVTTSGQTKAAPSALNNAGNAFSVTWHHS